MIFYVSYYIERVAQIYALEFQDMRVTGNEIYDNPYNTLIWKLELMVMAGNCYKKPVY